jgi:phenylpropionate dioxygenase-like ring-hydroxylating dioxygenase large terminal subunit
MASLQAALPAPHYVDESHWQRERNVVLQREWFCVGRRDALGLSTAGQRTVVDVAGESVLVTSDESETLHAFFNVCRHRGSQVVPADPDSDPVEPCAAKSLRCPYHSWTYGLDGRLLRAPHTEDLSEFDPSAFGLVRIGVDVWGGFVFVHLAPRGEPDLATSLGEVPERLVRYPLDRLVVGRRMAYEVRANWKVIAENYNECYHCAGVHPELVRLVPAFGRGGTELDWDGGIPMREGAWTFTESGTTNRRPFDGLNADEQVRHKGELIYPNLMISLSADHVAAFRLVATSAEHTTIECDILIHPSEVERQGFDISDAADFWDMVNRQDWAICESVQRGMNSRGYTQGWFAPMEDASLDIRRWLLPRLDRA